MVSAELGRRPSGPVVFDPIGRDPGIALWLNHLGSVLSAQDAGASLLTDRRVMASVERALVTMLLAGLRHSASSEFASRANSASPYYVRRAEAFIRANILEELTADGIAAAAKVSVRSIFYGFKRWRGTTPMAYVRDLRLEIARAELEKARLHGGTVSEAAMSAGFTNFSQFSKIYKMRFGQTPSATLMAD
jgi:AraC-like DNA-binding protein